MSQINGEDYRPAINEYPFKAFTCQVSKDSCLTGVHCDLFLFTDVFEHVRNILYNSLYVRRCYLLGITVIGAGCMIIDNDS